MHGGWVVGSYCMCPATEVDGWGGSGEWVMGG